MRHFSPCHFGHLIFFMIQLLTIAADKFEPGLETALTCHDFRKTTPCIIQFCHPPPIDAGCQIRVCSSHTTLALASSFVGSFKSRFHLKFLIICRAVHVHGLIYCIILIYCVLVALWESSQQGLFRVKT